MVALLYLPGCPFSTEAWPAVSNAVARFPQLEAVAVDVTREHRFLTDKAVVGVPTLLLYSPGRMSKYVLGHNEPPDGIVEFLRQGTGCDPSASSDTSRTVIDRGDIWQGPGGQGSDDLVLGACVAWMVVVLSAWRLGLFPASWKYHLGIQIGRL